ncbi:MAG: hypothetical protein CME06_13670 [Gemmatimonadetes bacterium]|nr:hypothetical protein [Gemmatimonadota bacterium]
MCYRELALALVLVATAHATTIRVPGDEPTIQAGLNAAGEGDTVLVAPGTYTAEGDKNLDFGGVDRVLVSEAGAEGTEIDCDWDGGGLYFHSGESAASIVSGFTISWAGDWGPPRPCQSGICCESSSSPTITECVIKLGAWNEIDCEDSSPTISKCVIGSADQSYGSGIACQSSSSPLVKECTIVGNNEAGVACSSSSSPSLIRCTITGNGRDFHGGGVTCYNASPILTGCLITENMAGGRGGGLYCEDSSPSLTNCTISGNISIIDVGGGLYCSDSSPVLLNCILWGDDPNEIEGGTPVLRYCDVEGGHTGEGNIDADPRFRSIYGYDYVLASNSPCIDSGDPTIEDGISDWHPRWPNWYANGARSDMGAYGGPGNGGWLP